MLGAVKEVKTGSVLPRTIRHGKVHLSFQKEIEVLEVRTCTEEDAIEYF